MAGLLENILQTPNWTEPYPAWIPLVLVIWLGACFGSFSNVLIYRLPRNLSVVGPRSFCPQCKKQVSWFDNIPMLSWVLLRGKCRHCGAGISLRYFLVEVMGALSVVLALARFGWTVDALSGALFLIILFDVAIIDWQHMIIPHTLTIAGMLLGLLFALFGSKGLPWSVVGLVVGGGIILTVSYGYKLLRGVIGMGGGDVMLMAMVGAFLGAWGALGVLFGGALFGTIFALSSGGGQVQGGAKLPFGTFLALSAALVMFFGDGIFAWYVGRF